MKNRKLKLITPILTLILGVFGAIATDAFNKADVLAPEEGYLDTTTPCTFARECSTIDNPVCRDINQNQLYGKDDPDAITCSQEVYMPQ